LFSIRDFLQWQDKKENPLLKKKWEIAMKKNFLTIL